MHTKLKIRTEYFINTCKKLYKNLYDYKNISYVNVKTDIKILCKKHGTFIKKPASLMRGYGCPTCTEENRHLTVSKLIKKFNVVHKNKYDYRLINNYKNILDKVNILCHIHGIFKQVISNHYRGHGCPKCATDEHIKKHIFNNEIFIEKANNIHKNKYSYHLVDYRGSMKKVNIVCNKHGIFKQSYAEHILAKHGCPKCSRIIISEKNKIPQEIIIERCKKVHGDKYDYTDVKFDKVTDKVNIKCPLHGNFYQSLMAHYYMKAGCPKCKLSKGELRIDKWLHRHDINHVHQKKFDGCIYKNKLKFDFYLPDINTCLEYNGIQHYKMGGYWMPTYFDVNEAKKTLSLSKIKDNIKRKYCKTNNIKLMVITYKNFQNIENFLFRHLWDKK